MRTPSPELQDVVFDAVDGEAFTTNSGHHYFCLVAACHDTGWHQAWDSLQDGKNDLPTWVIFRALLELGRSRSRVHVGFFLNYDITKWLADWSPNDRISLWKNGSHFWTAPNGRIYEVRWLPRKLFSIRTWDENLDNQNKLRSVTIYDVSGFFQTSFVKSLKNWGLEKEIEFIEKMKANRPTFKIEEREEIIRYSIMECDLLCQLMNRVRDSLLSEKIPLNKWFGAGSIAEAIFRKEGMGPHIQVPAINENPNPLFEEAVLGGYFGGRFELFKQGIIPSSHQYDINSAYPSAMADLPSFRNCRVRASEKYISNAPYALWYVTYNVGKEFPIGPLPYRTTKGSIVFPTKNEYGVWVHQIELRTALYLYGHKYFKIHGGFIIQPRSDVPAFRFIHRYAARRLLLKSRGDMRNIVLKLGLNSLYGKTAQAIGDSGKIPPFQNFFIAGFVTAATRAKLLDFAFGCGYRGSSVIQFATDGVFTTTVHSKIGDTTSENLGEWEYKRLKKKVIYLKPGVYFAERSGEENARETQRRTRGFRASRFTVNDVFREWRRNGPYGILRADDTRFVGIGSCIVTNSFKNYGRFITQPMEIRFGPGPTKLYKYGGQEPFGAGEKGEINSRSDYYVLIPNQDKIDGPSQPYSKHFRDKASTLNRYDDETQEAIRIEIQYDDQPDYEKYVGFGDAEPQD